MCLYVDENDPVEKETTENDPVEERIVGVTLLRR